ncbi:MAG TPA: hypothetical protein PKL15_17535 [Saprospiraceae bacterium]|nr:hypothetical protein [Saprospiraceae bacterium]
MNTQEELFQNWFRRLQVIYFALLSGLFLLTAVLHFTLPPLTESVGSPYIFIGLMAVLVIAGDAIFRKKTAEVASFTAANDRMNNYFTAFLIQVALFEAAVLIGLVVYHFVCNDRAVYIATMAGLLNFLSRLPRRAQVAALLGL